MQTYRHVVSYFAPRLRVPLLKLPMEAQKRVCEIRLRKERPLTLTLDGKNFFLQVNGALSTLPNGCIHCTDDDLQETLRCASGYSIHSFEQQMAEGFLTLNGGHRMGLGGTAVYQNGSFTGIRSIGSINLRIAREYPGISLPILKRFYCAERLPSILVCGEPLSGKTTVLRDLVYQLSTGSAGRIYKIAVVDERGELAGCRDGVPMRSLGYCTDILDGYPKGKGMNIALRTLSPDLIVCDEIGEQSDVDAILQSVHAGVPILASAHADSFLQLDRRVHLRRLIDAQVFDGFVFLKGRTAPGKIRNIETAGDGDAQMDGDHSAFFLFRHGGGDSGISPASKGAADARLFKNARFCAEDPCRTAAADRHIADRAVEERKLP